VRRARIDFPLRVRGPPIIVFPMRKLRYPNTQSAPPPPPPPPPPRSKYVYIPGLK